MRLPIEILVLACLIVGIVPAMTIGPFLATAVHSMLGDQTPTYSLVVWHGFGLPLIMSITALVAGAIMYLLFRDRLNEVKASPVIGRLKGRRTFEAVLRSEEHTSELQSLMRISYAVFCLKKKKT